MTFAVKCGDGGVYCWGDIVVLVVLRAVNVLVNVTTLSWALAV